MRNGTKSFDIGNGCRAFLLICTIVSTTTVVGFQPQKTNGDSTRRLPTPTNTVYSVVNHFYLSPSVLEKGYYERFPPGRLGSTRCRAASEAESPSTSQSESASSYQGDDDDDDEEEEDATIISVSDYWEQNSHKWERMLRIMDVRAAYASGSLDGILPSGRPSRGMPNERLISLTRAIELFDADEENFLVRRRFRQMKLEELRPRWQKVVSKRNSLRRREAWATAVEESETYRTFQKNLVEGSVESADASPWFSRLVVTLSSPALRVAASQRNRADGGIMVAQMDLCNSAGATPTERWTTAALLAELEEELQQQLSRYDDDNSVSSSSSVDFATQEAEKDIQDAAGGALSGVLLAIATAVLVNLLQQL